jgi:hypothetical protein
MLITSNLESVIARQQNYGVYKPEEFVQDPYNTAYWMSHLTEEMCEFLNCQLDEELDEAADVIIFLQNLTAYLYPEKTLTIDLSQVPQTPDTFCFDEFLLTLEQYLPNRKSWKTYSEVNWENFQNFISLVLKLISQNYFYGDIEKAYFAKEQYNATRISTGDWA